MEFENIILEYEERIAIITINRPSILNALNRKTIEELKSAILEIHENRDANVLIITGAGNKAFIVGADIHELDGVSPAKGLEFIQLGQEVFGLLEKIGKPSIAAVNGYALGGGCELALACDFRIASDNAKFGQPEIKLGNIPGWGGTQRLPRLIGKSRAKELIFTGEFISAQKAEEIGLVNKVVTQDILMIAAKELANKISSMSSFAISMAKKVIDEGSDANLDKGLILEAYGVGMCLTTYDQKEGVRAFFEKRKPIFKGE